MGAAGPRGCQRACLAHRGARCAHHQRRTEGERAAAAPRDRGRPGPRGGAARGARRGRPVLQRAGAVHQQARGREVRGLLPRHPRRGAPGQRHGARGRGRHCGARRRPRRRGLGDRAHLGARLQHRRQRQRARAVRARAGAVVQPAVLRRLVQHRRGGRGEQVPRGLAGRAARRAGPLRVRQREVPRPLRPRAAHHLAPRLPVAGARDRGGVPCGPLALRGPPHGARHGGLPQLPLPVGPGDIVRRRRQRRHLQRLRGHGAPAAPRGEARLLPGGGLHVPRVVHPRGNRRPQRPALHRVHTQAAHGQAFEHGRQAHGVRRHRDGDPGDQRVGARQLRPLAPLPERRRPPWRLQVRGRPARPRRRGPGGVRAHRAQHRRRAAAGRRPQPASRGHRADRRLRAQRAGEPAHLGHAHGERRQRVRHAEGPLPAPGPRAAGPPRRRTPRRGDLGPGPAARAPAAAVPRLPALGPGHARPRGARAGRREPLRARRGGVPRGAARGRPGVAPEPPPPGRQGRQAHHRRGARPPGVRPPCAGAQVAAGRA
mmetsp:Transcript_58704/g.165651  ORF Transcript_58704/g.165651 Transcript_58704/m.165651 type:complete len:543 (-) Transcript_58704:549-2177(-)